MRSLLSVPGRISGLEVDHMFRGMDPSEAHVGQAMGRPDSREVAWLIETKGPVWWRSASRGRPPSIHVLNSTDRNEWTDNAHEAVRFTRQEDAEAVIAAMDGAPIIAEIRATEHVFVSPSTLPVSTEESGGVVLSYTRIKLIVKDCTERMKRSGESHEMFAKWVSEGVNAAISHKQSGAQE